jgi:hypothetical protein
VDTRSVARPGFAGARSPRLTEADLAEAIHEDEARLGREMTPREREGFARGFFAEEYRDDLRRIAAAVAASDEDGE